MSTTILKPETVNKTSAINAIVKRFENKLNDILANGTENMLQIGLILKQCYGPAKNETAQMWCRVALEKHMDTGEGLPVGAAQARQCKAWLMNLWKSPTGRERISNPFGYREEEAMENFEAVRWVGDYRPNYSSDCRAPLFRVITTGGEWGFLYYMQGGKIEIVG